MDIVGYSKLSVNVMWIVPDWFVRLLWAHLRLRRGIAFEPVESSTDLDVAKQKMEVDFG